MLANPASVNVRHQQTMIWNISLPTTTIPHNHPALAHCHHHPHPPPATTLCLNTLTSGPCHQFPASEGGHEVTTTMRHINRHVESSDGDKLSLSTVSTHLPLPLYFINTHGNQVPCQRLTTNANRPQCDTQQTANNDNVPMYKIKCSCMKMSAHEQKQLLTSKDECPRTKMTATYENSRPPSNMTTWQPNNKQQSSFIIDFRWVQSSPSLTSPSTPLSLPSSQMDPDRFNEISIEIP